MIDRIKLEGLSKYFWSPDASSIQWESLIMIGIVASWAYNLNDLFQSLCAIVALLVLFPLKWTELGKISERQLFQFRKAIFGVLFLLQIAALARLGLEFSERSQESKRGQSVQKNELGRVAAYLLMTLTVGVILLFPDKSINSKHLIAPLIVEKREKTNRCHQVVNKLGRAAVWLTERYKVLRPLDLR